MLRHRPGSTPQGRARTESHDRTGAAGGDAAFTLRLLAACAILVGVAIAQDPGLLVSDTKLDLATAPVDWLARALHIWDPSAGFGQVQNQAHGYLWPMGPFFVLGWLVDLPGWLVQRLWQGLVMSVALVGAAKVCRALGVRSDLACLVGGFAFALSPRLLTSIGPISVEVWPSAIAPWVLLPLIRGSVAGSARRAAALSAVAVGMVGGVNAAASLAVLPLGALWLLTRTPGPRRRALMIWWPVFTALATAWWVVPLLVMGAYSPPFLDYTESSAVTTYPTTLFDTLRGTSHWVPYLDSASRAGNELIRTPWLAIMTGVLVLVGLAGLLDRRTPHRQFLALSLTVGVLMVTAGHQGAVQGWFAAPIADLLDGPLSPLRNVHKLDVVLRLPLIAGLAFVVDRAVALAHQQDRPRAERLNSRILVAATVLAIVATATPALAGRLQPSGATLGAPDYWQEAADYLAAQGRDGTALVVPGAGSAEFDWGTTKDEPMQWLAESPWAVRNVGLLAGPGTFRMLDGIGQRLAEGRGSPGLSAALRRAGVEHLVVRNDLRRTDDVPDPVLVHQAIATTPGLLRVASFGPVLGGGAHLREDDERVVLNGGWRSSYPAVEVYSVVGESPSAVAAEEPTVVAAGPEDLPDLLDLGVVDSAPVVLAADGESGSDPGRVVLTDGLRQRERSFARLHDGASAVLTPGDVRRVTTSTSDFNLPAADRWSTTARLVGAAEVSASSSRSDAGAFGGSRRGTLPYAAIDGAVDTAWESDGGQSEPGWWEVDLLREREVSEVTVTAATDAPARQRVRVVTAHGASRDVELSPGGSRRLVLPTGKDGTTAVTWLRVEDVSEVARRRLVIAEVEIPGVSVQRVLELPRVPDAWGPPDAIVLRADRDARSGCVEVDLESRCAAGRGRTSEDGPALRRSFVMPDTQSYDVTMRARPRAGAALDALILKGQPASAEVSSTAVPDPRGGAVAAIDGDPGTAWLADPDDEQVELSLAWLGRRVVRAIELDVDDDTAARLPEQVLLRFRRGAKVVERVVDLGSDGRASFRQVRADQVTIRVLSAEDATDRRFDGSSDDLPVGIGEVRLRGLPFLPLSLSTDPVKSRCGVGPTLQVGSTWVSTAVTASAQQLARGVAVPVQACGSAGPGPLSVPLSAGRVDFTSDRADAFEAESAVLTATDSKETGTPVADAHRTNPSATSRTLRPEPGSDVVAVRENASSGWVASQGGEKLESLRLDGWQQGFRLAGDGPVTIRMAPDRAYRAGLAGGAAAVLVFLVLLGLCRRRWAGPVFPPLEDRAIPAWGAGVVSVVAAGLVAGTLGVVVGGVAVVASWRLARRVPESAPWILVAPVLAAAMAYSLRPWGGAGGWAGDLPWVSYVVLVPFVAVPALAATPRNGSKRFSFMAGSSTRR